MPLPRSLSEEIRKRRERRERWRRTTSNPVWWLRHLIGLGVLWHVWDHYGFWWGLLYGVYWPVWIGFRLAEWLLP